MSGRLLVLAPHADDEVYGCGGTIARRSDEGWEVHVAVATLGDVTRADGQPKCSGAVRRDELAQAAERLGVARHRVLFEGLENRLDTLPALELIARVDTVLAEVAYDQVLFPVPSHHQDHHALHRACRAALRRRPGRDESLVALYEYPHALHAPGDGGLYVDISGHYDRKQAALEAYASQLAPDPEPLSLEGARRLAALRGMEIGVEYAERFALLLAREAYGERRQA